MRDHDDGDPVSVQRFDQRVHFLHNHRIEAGHRFVKYEQIAFGAESPGQQHSLLLAA